MNEVALFLDTLYSAKYYNQPLGHALASESTPSVRSDTSSRGGNDLENTERSVITLSSPSIPPLAMSHLLSGHIPVSLSDSQPASLISTTFHLNAGDNDKGRHSATSNHTMGTSDSPDLVDNTASSATQPYSPHHKTTQPSGGGQAAGDVALLVSSPAEPASFGSTSIFDTAHDQATRSDSQSGGHIAVDIGVLTTTAQVGLEITGFGDDVVQDQPTERDAVISMRPAS